MPEVSGEARRGCRNRAGRLLRAVAQDVLAPREREHDDGSGLCVSLTATLDRAGMVVGALSIIVYRAFFARR